ncbi:MAG: hypothetical protein WC310_04945 [Patescibacteria group bacterium]|jgi:hypothetical protein
MVISRAEFFAGSWVKKYKKLFAKLSKQSSDHAAVLRLLCVTAIREPASLEDLNGKVEFVVNISDRLITTLEDLECMGFVQTISRMDAKLFAVADPFNLWVQWKDDQYERAGIQFFLNNRGKNWTPFWFEGSAWYGVVDSWTTWNQVVSAYGKVYCFLETLLAANNQPQKDTDQIITFGFVSECNGSLTLSKWAKKVGNDLSVD